MRGWSAIGLSFKSCGKLVFPQLLGLTALDGCPDKEGVVVIGLYEEVVRVAAECEPLRICEEGDFVEVEGVEDAQGVMEGAE
jgi:hypothetical protein